MDSLFIQPDAPALDALLEKVYRESGYDFRHYKRGTIARRLAGRLSATGTTNCRNYMQYLDNCPDEYRNLADYLTIRVSGYFRNPYTFEQITGRVMPELLAGKQIRGDSRIRFWSAACARGEEPYSLAIMLVEFLGARRQDYDIAIYATDICRRSLEEAQEGLYAEKDLEALPVRIRRDYFIPRGALYQVSPDIRRMVRFGRFDLNKTDKPPFEKLDAAYCCNVLIYLQRPLQERVFDMLLASLADSGYLCWVTQRARLPI